MLRRNVHVEMSGTPLAANIDAIVEQTGEPVEAKTVGLFHRSDEWWGDAGTDQVPDRVNVQAHVHLLCTDAKLCHVPAFIGGRGFVLFEIPRHTSIADAVVAAATEFWAKHVQADTPPTGSRASLQVIKLIRRTPEKIVNVQPELVAEWIEAKDAAKAAKMAAQRVEEDLLASLGDAEAGMCGELGAVTYYETTRKGYEVKETSYRTLRHKKKGL